MGRDVGGGQKTMCQNDLSQRGAKISEIETKTPLERNREKNRQRVIFQQNQKCPEITIFTNPFILP